MRIEVENLRCRVREATDAEVRWLRSYLKFEDARAKVTGRSLNLLNTWGESASFPTGLLPIVMKGYAEQEGGGPLEVADLRQRPGARQGADLGWLRGYQRDAVEACIAKGRGIVKCPTGSGKTEIAVGLVREVDCRWLFLVHRTILLDQTLDRWRSRTGEPAGIVHRGEWQLPDGSPGSARFVVGTFQTVFAAMRGEKQSPARLRALALLAWADGIIVDECHVLPAWSFWKVANNAKRAYYRIGMSGTPLDRTDQRSFLAVAQLGPVIYTVPAEKLMEAGVLARPTIRMVPLFQRHASNEWAEVYRHLVVESDVRNALVAEMGRHCAKPALLFVREIEHGHTLTRMLQNRGVRAEFVWGDAANDERHAAIARLVSGETEVLVCSVILQEGVDIPTLRSVVLGAGGKSAIAALQQIGRGMRPAAGKATFEVWDVGDRGNKWMQRHTQARYRTYKAEGYTVEILATAEVAQLGLPVAGVMLPRKVVLEKERLRARLDAGLPQE